MTKDEAHDLLNKRKQGLAVAQHLVNHALVVCGDISPSCFNGKNSRLEGSSMAQGAGVGEMPNIPMAWDNHRFNQYHEGAQ
jgi:hypothetical protein